jgi:hypothetical protein
MKAKTDRGDVALSIAAIVFVTFAHLPLLYLVLRQPFEGRVLPVAVIAAVLFFVVVAFSKDRLQVAAIPFVYLGGAWLLGFIKSCVLPAPFPRSREITLLMSAVCFGIGYLMFRIRKASGRGVTIN